MLTALPQFGFIEIRGVDAEKFFQGYCTRDLSKLGNGLAMYTAVPTIQGRVLSTAAIARLSDANSADNEPGLLLRLDQQMVDPVINVLACYATRLPSDRDVLTFSEEDQEGEIWTSESLDAPIIDGGWTARALGRGFLWTTQTESDQFLPQELAMDQFGGVDFDKGCYLGQEIIARVHFKGKTKQAVRIGQIDQLVQGDEPLTVTDSEGASIGAVIQAAQLEDHWVVAAMIKRDAQVEGARIGDASLSFI
jgi:folate-binding protein YgfZ